jgi:hypothetical protein
LAFLTPFVARRRRLGCRLSAMHNTASPYLSGAGRLVLKETVILAGGWLLVVDGARAILAALLGSSQRRSRFRCWPSARCMKRDTKIWPSETGHQNPTSVVSFQTRSTKLDEGNTAISRHFEHSPLRYVLETDWLVGLRGLELRNDHPKSRFEMSRGFLAI